MNSMGGPGKYIFISLVFTWAVFPLEVIHSPQSELEHEFFQCIGQLVHKLFTNMAKHCPRKNTFKNRVLYF